eukprot:comp25252_c0_seq1/m.46979 comp25252_c0_seq1/g.46979  ORF comp25252_c0_seq1/g.46979 comp25252_c0_seq1/m.46979 type:complete len:124 (-) comp25252_c0_seq1:148-519(-)
MSYCRDDGKDKIYFLTQEDQAELMKDNAVLQMDDEDSTSGAIKPNGEIDWDCPCLQGMAYGACGAEFREAFSCFVKSTAEPKGLDCVESFEKMQACVAQHPELYGGDDDKKTDAAPAEAPAST